MKAASLARLSAGAGNGADCRAQGFKFKVSVNLVHLRARVPRELLPYFLCNARIRVAELRLCRKELESEFSISR